MNTPASGPHAYGLDVQNLPEGWIPLEAVLVIKCLDEDGDAALALRATDSLCVWDCVGMLTCALDSERDRAQHDFTAEHDDDDGD